MSEIEHRKRYQWTLKNRKKRRRAAATSPKPLQAKKKNVKTRAVPGPGKPSLAEQMGLIKAKKYKEPPADEAAVEITTQEAVAEEAGEEAADAVSTDAVASGAVAEKAALNILGSEEPTTVPAHAVDMFSPRQPQQPTPQVQPPKAVDTDKDPTDNVAHTDPITGQHVSKDVL